MKTPVAKEMKVILQKFGRVVFEQEFVMPDGQMEEFFLFCPKSRLEPAIILPLTSENNVLAIRQFRFGANDIVIEIPGGNRKPKQTIEECAKIELLEETGYEAQKIVNLGDGFWFDPASWRASFAALLATRCRKVRPLNLDATEIIEVVEISFKEWLQKIFKGEIKDSKTIVVTFLALPHLGVKIS